MLLEYNERAWLKETISDFQKVGTTCYGKTAYITRLDFGHFRLSFGKNENYLMYIDKDKLKRLRKNKKYNVEELIGDVELL